MFLTVHRDGGLSPICIPGPRSCWIEPREILLCEDLSNSFRLQTPLRGSGGFGFVLESPSTRCRPHTASFNAALDVCCQSVFKTPVPRPLNLMYIANIHLNSESMLSIHTPVLLKKQLYSLIQIDVMILSYIISADSVFIVPVLNTMLKHVT